MGRMWRAAFARMVGILAALVLLTGTAAAQERLSGEYYGLDEARGLTISLQDTGSGATGRIAAQDGSGQAINGQRQGGAIVSKLIYQGRQGTVRLIPQGIGLGFEWTADDGTGSAVFAFGRRGLELPPPSPNYVPENRIGNRVPPHVFAASYEFWRPETVARTYGALDEKFRAILQLFPAVHTDLLWKLCQSESTVPSLGEALRGEGVTCAQVDTTLKNAQRTGGFNTFKRRVHAERADAERAVQCAQGIHPPEVCAASAKRTQQAAMSLETVMTVLRGI